MISNSVLLTAGGGGKFTVRDIFKQLFPAKVKQNGQPPLLLLFLYSKGSYIYVIGCGKGSSVTQSYTLWGKKAKANQLRSQNTTELGNANAMVN